MEQNSDFFEKYWKTFYKQLELLRYSKGFFLYFSRPFWWENHAVCWTLALRPISCLFFQQHLSQTWATRFHYVDRIQWINVSISEMHDSMYFISNTRGSIIFPLFLCFFQLKKTDKKWLEFFFQSCFFADWHKFWKIFKKSSASTLIKRMKRHWRKSHRMYPHCVFYGKKYAKILRKPCQVGWFIKLALFEKKIDCCSWSILEDVVTLL